MNKAPLHFSEYAEEIELFDMFNPVNKLLSIEEQEELVEVLLLRLQERIGGVQNTSAMSYTQKRRALHGVINTLSPNVLHAADRELLNQLLLNELVQKPIATEKEMATYVKQVVGSTRLAVWQGDISTLQIDAIVNAANSEMLGCFQPLHACIDNVIHSAAGVQLRDDCDIIMRKQGFAEPTGTAKITRAYNLPSKFVLHTVGPIVNGTVSEQNKIDLAASYTSCLNIGKELSSINSIAFCGISTGVFGYPAYEAAKLAHETVCNWLKNNPNSLDLVVFNVFSDDDKEIYDALVNTSYDS